jgi:pectinesterase
MPVHRTSDANGLDEALTNRETMEWMDAAKLPPEQEVAPGLTASDFVKFLSRPPTPPGVEYEGAVQYGTAGAGGRPLRLFLYRRSDVTERRPGVIFIHGGGWTGMHPFTHIRHANALAAHGYVTATTAYRLYPEGTIADCISDTKCAVRWMRANADRLGLDSDRIAVAGGSAGGHLAAMIALTPGRFEGDGGNPGVSSAVSAAVLWYPATDLRAPGATYPNIRQSLNTVAGTSDESELLALSPVTYVHPGAPPIFTMVGDLDNLTTAAEMRTFHRTLDRHGVPNKLKVFPGRGHAFDLLPGDWETSYALMEGFFDRELGARSGTVPSAP